MVRNLSHNDWVIQQFKKYLRPSYRDVIIHTSIIEGVLRNESKKGSFDSANKFLLQSKKIDSSEFYMFNEVRDIRNKLIHESFMNKLVQNEIDKLRDDLRVKILYAYQNSNFLDNTIFKQYNVTRP